MSNFKNEDDFLARWLAGDLTKAELDRFEAHPDFALYEKLATASANLKIAPIDETANLQKIKAKRKAKAPVKSRSLLRRVFIPAAAILLLCISYFAFYHQPIFDLETGIGEQITHQLPDQSTIHLNANSRVEYAKADFINARNITLKGEAFFDVQSGSGFVVNTRQGQVTVLGTRFLVRSNPNDLLVECQSGRVQVADQKNNAIELKKGERVRINQKTLTQKENIEPIDIANWQKGVSKFTSEPMKNVILALENQFGIEIEIATEKKQIKFTGSFLHKNVDTALKMVLQPMGWTYRKLENGRYSVE